MPGRCGARLDPPPVGDHAVEHDPEVGAPLTVSITQPTEARVIVRAFGEIDLLTASRWAAAVREATDRAAANGTVAGRRPVSGLAPQVLCDLGAITFFGAAGVSVLVGAARRAQAQGVVLVVTAPDRLTRRVLALAGVDDVRRTCRVQTTEHLPPPRPLIP